MPVLRNPSARGGILWTSTPGGRSKGPPLPLRFLPRRIQRPSFLRKGSVRGVVPYVCLIPHPRFAGWMSRAERLSQGAVQ